MRSHPVMLAAVYGTLFLGIGWLWGTGLLYRALKTWEKHVHDQSRDSMCGSPDNASETDSEALDDFYIK
jgi:hypothetical protein